MTNPSPDTSTAENRRYMGTAEEARLGLVKAAVDYRAYQGPHIATGKEHRKREALAHEAGNRLKAAALLWLWHEENPL